MRKVSVWWGIAGELLFRNGAIRSSLTCNSGSTKRNTTTQLQTPMFGLEEQDRTLLARQTSLEAGLGREVSSTERSRFMLDHTSRFFYFTRVYRPFYHDSNVCAILGVQGWGYGYLLSWKPFWDKGSLGGHLYDR